MVNGILVLFLNNFKGPVFFYFESYSKLTQKVILVWYCSIVYVIASKEINSIDSDKGDSNKRDSVI